MFNLPRPLLYLSLVLAITSAGCSIQPAPAGMLSAQELDHGWLMLFDGESLFGWQPNSKADWHVAGGVISVGQGEPGLLCTNTEFADYDLKVDFRSAPLTNSGIFLRTSRQPKDPTVDCYELNIAEPALTPFPTGSLVGRKKGSAPPPPGDWHRYEVTVQGGRVQVRLDGREVLDYTDPRPLGRGAIGLQFNKGRVEFRNIKLRPLGLTSIFNGRDLAGWTEFPGKQSVFSVTPAGELHVEHGPGQLESQAQYADFVLQLEVLTGGKGLNSGIFFRSIPGQFAQGYESQIHNGYRDGDRTKPVDAGTGAIYRRQNARRIVADDLRWFHMTLIACGPHMAAWVEGIPVSDWTDQRPPDENPRKGLRLKKGTLAIQGHDASTKLSLKNLRIAEPPPR